MEKPLVQGRHPITGDAISIRCERGTIQSVELCPDLTDLPWVAPALFDLQINGCQGIGFHREDLTIEQIGTVVETCREHGIGALCPTLVTNSFEALHRGFGKLREACESGLEQSMPAFHMEGPYISPEDGPRGAHAREHVRPPDYDEFRRIQESAGGRIRLLTLAPEQPGAIEFIEKVTAEGVVIAIGHTAATGEQIHDAIRAGAKLSTHLGNGSHAILPRHENYIWEQLGADDLMASLICDGHHLPASVVKTMIRAKQPHRCILTCDASTLAGAKPGRYSEWGQDLEVQQNQKVVVAGTPYLAGSGVFLDTCIRFVLTHTETSLGEVIDMATTIPRQLLNLPPTRLQPGDPADFILFRHDSDEPFQILET